MVLNRGLLVCGNMNIDRIYSVECLPSEGESTPISAERTVFGGCGGNIAIAAARVGVRTRLSSVIGQDFPADYSRNMEMAGVELDLVSISDSLPSPYCIILSAPGGRQSYAFNPGSMIEQKDLKVPLDSKISHVHIATSDPSFSIRAAKELSRMGSSVSFDPGMEIFFRWNVDLLRKILAHCDRFFGNIGEWKHLGEQLGWGGDVHTFSGIGVPHFIDAFEHIEEAVITLGAAGSVLITKDGSHYEGPIEVGEVVDATGAGDAFRGGFYGALTRGYSSGEALKFGNAMGALSIKSEGPQDYEATWDKLIHLTGI